MPTLYALRPYGWTTQHPAPFVDEAGNLRAGRGSVNVNTASGTGCYGDRGFRRKTTIGTNTNVASATFAHRHTDGKVYEWMSVDTGLWAWNGSAWASIATGLTAKFAPAHYLIDGWSGYFNGTNAQARLIRKAATWLEAVLHDVATPTLGTLSSAVGSGTWSDTGPYNVRVAWVDEDGEANVYSHPSNVQTITLGATNHDLTITRPSSPPARATHWRVAITAADVEDAPSNYLYYEDIAAATTSKVYSDLPTVSTAQAFVDAGGTYRQAHLPIDNVDIAWVADDRLFVASSSGVEVAWSESGQPNHWYTDQVLNVGNQKQIGGVIRGGAQVAGLNVVFTETAMFTIEGNLTRDDQVVGDTQPSFTINVWPRTFFDGFGTVSHASIVSDGARVFFWSPYGPALWRVGSTPELLDPEHLRPGLNRVDTDYLDRIVGARDPILNMIGWTVPRKTNASRPQDGAATAGICDQIWRWDVPHNIMSPPLLLEAVHLRSGPSPDTQGTTESRARFMAMGPHASLIELHRSWGGGVGDDVSSTDYHGKLATNDTTTSATVSLSGITDGSLRGATVTFRYDSKDDNFPGEAAQRTITTNTTTSGSLTIGWEGPLTLPSGIKWTVRIGGMRKRAEVFSRVPIPGAGHVQVFTVDVLLADIVSQESQG